MKHCKIQSFQLHHFGGKHNAAASGGKRNAAANGGKRNVAANDSKRNKAANFLPITVANFFYALLKINGDR